MRREKKKLIKWLRKDYMNSYKKDFPWFKNNKDISYLDNSATTLKPYSVIEAINLYYESLSTNPHATDSKLGQKTNAVVLSARKNISNFFGCDENQLIFTPGATHSLNYSTHIIKEFINEGDEIIITDADHSSSSAPIINLAKEKNAKIIIVENNGEFVERKDIIKKLSSKTKLVSIMNASNTLGYYIDSSIVKEIKKYNSQIIVSIDATQAIAHKKMNFKETEADFISGSAHKILGPTGIGFLYIKDSNNSKFKPLIIGGGAVNDYNIEEINYSTSPNKYEAGTPNVAGILGFNAAINYILKIGFEEIERIENNLKNITIKELSKLEHISIVNHNPDLGIICINHKFMNAQDFAHFLSEKNILVRSGLSCAKMLRSSKINCSSFVRISFYIYNDEEDIKKLIKAIKSYKKGDELLGLFN
jgi:cysteine desulfurase / selenocysteine lyase